MSDSHQTETIGIVFALEAETRGLKRVLSHSRRVKTRLASQIAWRFGGVTVVAEVGGIGRERCQQTTNRLIDQGARWIACAGFAAALDSIARAGDVVVAERVLLPEPDALPIRCSSALMASIPPSGRLGYTIWRSDMVTWDSMVLRASAKRDIYRTTGAAALDMEAHAVGEACDHRGVPFVVVKGISDTADEDLPEEMEALAVSRRWADRLGLIVRRPMIWPDLWRLRRNTLLASDNLGDVLGTMLLRLFG